MPATCASASTIKTPGISGYPGTCPGKNHSLKVTPLIPTPLWPGARAIILSTSKNGKRWGRICWISTLLNTVVSSGTGYSLSLAVSNVLRTAARSAVNSIFRGRGAAPVAQLDILRWRAGRAGRRGRPDGHGGRGQPLAGRQVEDKAYLCPLRVRWRHRNKGAADGDDPDRPQHLRRVIEVVATHDLVNVVEDDVEYPLIDVAFPAFIAGFEKDEAIIIGATPTTHIIRFSGTIPDITAAPPGGPRCRGAGRGGGRRR